jgi:hypothetical protein
MLRTVLLAVILAAAAFSPANAEAPAPPIPGWHPLTKCLSSIEYDAQGNVIRHAAECWPLVIIPGLAAD